MGKIIPFDRDRRSADKEGPAPDEQELQERNESMERHPAMIAKRRREQQREQLRKEGLRQLVQRAIDESEKPQNDDESSNDTPNQE